MGISSWLSRILWILPADYFVGHDTVNTQCVRGIFFFGYSYWWYYQVGQSSTGGHVIN